MTKKEIADMIKSFGLPWRYSHFTETPVPPYVVYYYPSDNDVFADDSNYVNKRQLFIELFSNDGEETALIESTLRQNNITWYKSRDFLNDENIFQITYESEVLING